MKLTKLWLAFSLTLSLVSSPASAEIGITEIAGKEGNGDVTLFYPSSSAEEPIQRGLATFRWAVHGTPQRGNGRLIVISHGSGGSPWENADLAQTLVRAGFIVAVPNHYGDNYNDRSLAGPESWKRRPLEASRAIDAVSESAHFAPLLKLDKVGIFGMSAGGHTVLSLAGGRWSPAKFKQHCEQHLRDDFHACVGLAMQLNGGAFDRLKQAVALAMIRMRFMDENWYVHHDPRIKAAVAAVPYAADFDLSSFDRLRIPLAIVTAAQDQWLRPPFHSTALLHACTACVHLSSLAHGSHGALMSPKPRQFTGLLADLLNDPPEFDRSKVALVFDAITAYFGQQLLP